MAYRTPLTGSIFGLRRGIDRLFEDTHGRPSSRSGWVPAVDVREDGKEIVLEAELPGVERADVEVTAENGVLTIRGEKRSSSTENGGRRYHVIERAHGSFLRAFRLPERVDEGRIEAELTNGLLLVRIPKEALPRHRRIEVRSSNGKPPIQGAPTRSLGNGARQPAGASLGPEPSGPGASGFDGGRDSDNRCSATELSPDPVNDHHRSSAPARGSTQARGRA